MNTFISQYGWSAMLLAGGVVLLAAGIWLVLADARGFFARRPVRQGAEVGLPRAGGAARISHAVVLGAARARSRRAVPVVRQVAVQRPQRPGVGTRWKSQDRLASGY